MSTARRLEADAPFSYACTRCNRCCTGKRIQVNPYEIARLARATGVSTSTFRERYLIDGAVLRRDAADRCVLLGEAGCSVHADRPLVCRLFPLGRIVEENGESRFVQPAYTPPAAGDFGVAGTVAAYVEAQGAAPFMAAADRYFRWFCEARQRLAASDSGPAAAVAGDLLDIDGQVAAWAAAENVDEPPDVEERHRLHIDILYRALEEGGDDVPIRPEGR